MRSELDAVAHLKRIFTANQNTNGDASEVGIGDDAAAFAAPATGHLVWTVDEQVQNTHFRPEWVSWHDIGYRSFVAAASDIAAMGGAPTRALSALALPADFRDEDFDALLRGQADAALEIGAAIVGGNLARAREAHIATTVLGNADRLILRSGAQVGDDVLVIGAVGLAGLGLLALERRIASALLDDAILAWRRPAPRFDAAGRMALVATSGIDLSDGLAGDLQHLADASGVSIAIDEAALLAHGDFYGVTSAAALLERDPLDAMLYGGEDYALVVTSKSPIAGFFRIGSVRAGSGVSCSERAVEPRGFDHFSR